MADNSTFTATPAGGYGTDGVPRKARGKAVFDATAITAADSVRIACGFLPRYVRWINMTDRVEVEWVEGMADNSCLKTAANGTRTLEVTSGNGGITVDARGFRVLQNATLAAVLASKDCYWEASE